MNLNIKSFANSTNLVHRSWTPQFHPEFFATDLATLPQHQILRRVITWALSNPKLGCTVAMACPTLCPNDVTMAEMCRKHRWNNRQPCHASVPGTFTTCQSAMVAMVQLDLGFTKQLMSFATSIPPAFFWYNSLRNIECKCYQIHSCKMSFFDINANAINIFETSPNGSDHVWPFVYRSVDTDVGLMNITAQHDDHSGRLFLHVDNLGMSQLESTSFKIILRGNKHQRFWC